MPDVGWKLFEPCRSGDHEDCSADSGRYRCSCECHGEESGYDIEMGQGGAAYNDFMFGDSPDY